MIKPISINHAYNGFLYAPLFLAYDLGLFNKIMLLDYREGDVDAIKSLANTNGSAHNWFAVCDPSALDIERVRKEIGYDEVFIVGSFITKLPVWIYNSNTAGKIEQPLNSEDEFKNLNKIIDTIRCYKKDTTGYLIGHRIKNKLENTKIKIEECNFGKEFEPPLKDDTLIVTSDILKVTSILGNNKIIFDFHPKKCPELNPFLFTAIFTLKSVIDNHLYSILSVLAGIRTIIELMYNEQLDDGHIELLFTRYKDELIQIDPNIENEPKLGHKIIKDSIKTLCKEEIYSKDFDIDIAEKGYNIAKSEWENLIGRKFSDVKQRREPIPSLLIKENWKEDTSLLKLFYDKIRSKPKVVYTDLDKKYRTVLPLLIFFVLVNLSLGGLAFCHNLASHVMIYLQYTVLILCVYQAIIFSILCYDVFFKFNKENFSFWLSCLGPAIPIEYACTLYIFTSISKLPQ